MDNNTPLLFRAEGEEAISGLIRQHPLDQNLFTAAIVILSEAKPTDKRVHIDDTGEIISIDIERPATLDEVNTALKKILEAQKNANSAFNTFAEAFIKSDELFKDEAHYGGLTSMSGNLGHINYMICQLVWYKYITIDPQWLTDKEAYIKDTFPATVVINPDEA